MLMLMCFLGPQKSSEGIGSAVQDSGLVSWGRPVGWGVSGFNIGDLIIAYAILEVPIL